MWAKADIIILGLQGLFIGGGRSLAGIWGK